MSLTWSTYAEYKVHGLYSVEQAWVKRVGLFWVLKRKLTSLDVRNLITEPGCCCSLVATSVYVAKVKVMGTESSSSYLSFCLILYRKCAGTWTRGNSPNIVSVL